MGPSERKEVRILLVGDRGVGKTSLILSLVSEEFPLDVPAKAEDITIPGDLTPEKVPTCIVDYSAAEQTDALLETEIRRSDVVCVVYAADDEESLDSVTDHWLPFVRRAQGDVPIKPVILVGNRVDLVDFSTMESVLPVMKDFEEIETCVECSAMNLKNISELFYFAQKAVLHPSVPLWNYAHKDLSDRCKKALRRVFLICDVDGNGTLSDSELETFQRKCFGMDLDPGTLGSLKNIVRANCSEGVVDDGLTVKGFLVLHALFIQRGRHETTWTVLRKFGYDDDLSFKKSFLAPIAKIEKLSELSQSGHDFFAKLFEKHDRDRDGFLNSRELIDVFAVCPICPFGRSVRYTVPAHRGGAISLRSFLGLWTLMTLLDSGSTLEYLAYLGYNFVNDEENQLGALMAATDSKRKNVYRCLVMGPKGSGKTTFCQCLLGRSNEDVLEIPDEDFPRRTISTVQVYGQEKYLVLEDVDGFDRSAEFCDVCCLLFDASDPRSFQSAATIYLKHFRSDDGHKVPVLIVANKSDKTAPRQEYHLQPEAFCTRHRIPPPQPFSTIRSKVNRDIFVKLATMAAFPNLRRLVHAMILKQPPREWIGTFRLDPSFYFNFIFLLFCVMLLKCLKCHFSNPHFKQGICVSLDSSLRTPEAFSSSESESQWQR